MWSCPPGRRSPSAATRCGRRPRAPWPRRSERAELPYELNPGDGAFYGPKIDFHIEDVMGRTWQCATCQLDFAMPERFDLDYVGEDNQRHRPVMIHRTVLGSIERFLGILIEHYGGAFPAWLAPVQASVVPVADRHNDYANRGQERADVRRAARRGRRCGRSRWAGRSATARCGKVPFMLVVGDREVEQRDGDGAHSGQQGHPDAVPGGAPRRSSPRACGLPGGVEPLALEPACGTRLYCGLA